MPSLLKKHLELSIVHHCERGSPMKNRKREICTSGSVRGAAAVPNRQRRPICHFLPISMCDRRRARHAIRHLAHDRDRRAGDLKAGHALRQCAEQRPAIGGRHRQHQRERPLIHEETTPVLPLHRDFEFELNKVLPLKLPRRRRHRHVADRDAGIRIQKAERAGG